VFRRNTRRQCADEQTSRAGCTFSPTRLAGCLSLASGWVASGSASSRRTLQTRTTSAAYAPWCWLTSPACCTDLRGDAVFLSLPGEDSVRNRMHVVANGDAAVGEEIPLFPQNRSLEDFQFDVPLHWAWLG
jgi:hypothetical protein